MSDKIFIIKTRIFPRVKRAWHALLSSWLARFLLLLVAAFDGLLLAKYGGFWLVKMGLINLTIASNKQLAILLMSLPVLFALWLFRTFDTREQIQKTQENAEAAREGVKATREALNAETLGRYINMLFSSSLEARCVALIRLADIKRQGKFAEEIDSATRQGIDLKRAVLEGENLSGLNLDGAFLIQVKFHEVDLSGASLRFARIDGATLSNANMREANLRFADFKRADLIGADLGKAQLQNANLEDLEMTGTIRSLAGAIYNGSTKLPGWIDPKQEGMKEEIDPNRLT